MITRLRVMVLLLVLVVCFGTASAARAADFEWTDNFWGRSTDAGNRMGYEYLQDVIDSQGSAVNAQTGYLTDPDPYYWSNSGYSSQFTLNLELAGYANNNIMGYYQGSGAGNLVYTPVFLGQDGPGAAASAVINGNFGLYLKTADNNIFYTDRFLNNNGSHAPQGLVYALEQGTKWMVGWEDMKFATGDNDFQDMVVTVTAAPEPVSSALFIIGGIGLYLVRRKKISAF